MAPEVLFLLVCSLLAVPLCWALPDRSRQAGVALWSLAALTVISPASAGWWLGASTGSALLVAAPVEGRARAVLTAGWGSVLVAALVVGRELPAAILIGGAYFTLRSLHLVLDRWTGRLPATPVRPLLEFQLFLPVLVAGPITRYQHFAREVRRRRYDPVQFWSGAERVLFGLLRVLVVGIYLVGLASAAVVPQLGEQAFVVDWGTSAIGWVQLYFIFAGFSDVALGLAAMTGLRLEENFDRPWRARDLMDFWMRWHRTLSRWCRDYVFTPVSVATRSRVLGLVAAMVVMGLWHDSSLYYLCWATWQAAGIAWTRAARGAVERSGGPADRIWRWLGPITVVAWLTLTHPVISIMIGVEQ